METTVMLYMTKYDYLNADKDDFPPLLARLGDEPPPETSAELYLAVPDKWIPIGHPIIAEMMSTGEWSSVSSHDVDAVIERIRKGRRGRSRYWLVSLDPDAPHAIVRSYNDGPLKSYALGRREWVSLSDDDPLLASERAEWDEMLLGETAVVGQSLEFAWYQRRAFPDADTKDR